MALPYNARNQYLKTQVETASKEQLVVMLFDGIIRFTEMARKAINEHQIEDKHKALMRAQAIIMELLCTVDKEKGGDVAKNLLSLHAYAFNCLVACNLKEETAKIDEVQKIYRELKEGWVAAMDKLGISSTGGKLMAGVGIGQNSAPAQQTATKTPTAAPRSGIFARNTQAPASAASRPALGGYGRPSTFTTVSSGAVNATPAAPVRTGIMLSA